MRSLGGAMRDSPSGVLHLLGRLSWNGAGASVPCRLDTATPQGEHRIRVQIAAVPDGPRQRQPGATGSSNPSPDDGCSYRRLR
jgi:hypothetical protein